jgi:1,2-diacylglycerol 3-beta-galactosyltransferase
MAHNKKKILILTGDAGLGHRSAAEALLKSFETLYPNQCQLAINNPLNHPDLPDFVRESQADYDAIVKNIPEIYRLGYEVSDSPLPVALMEEGFTLLLLEVMREVVADFQPDLILTTYPVYAAPLTALCEADNLEKPIISTVTDLVTVHHVWFHKELTLLTVPTDAVRKRALKAGLQPDQLANTGIPVDPEIYKLKDEPKSDLREDLDWELDLTTILVVGSPRVKSLMDILIALDSSKYTFQFALVAGGNEKLYDQFTSTAWDHPAKVYHFIDFMPKLMRASDMIICKAGGLIVTESLASGLPIMLVHMLPGQERGNVDYVRDHGAGAFCKTPGEALNTLSQWLANDRVELGEIAQNAESIGQAQAALKVVKAAWDLLK